MKRNRVFAVLGIAVALGLVATGVIRSRFERDLAVAAERAALGSEVVATRCGPIEVQQGGVGTALLMIHGSGGGHDQGMAWAQPLVLVVPIAYKPGTVADSAPPVSDDKDAMLLRLLGSDFLFWTALHLARDPLIRHVLATPPEQVGAASEQERARVNDLAERILPVSRRAAGLRDDTLLGKRLGPYALQSIRVPTLVVSARDDGFGTYAAAQYTASRIPGAKFIGFDNGGHLLVGHDAAVQAEIVKLLTRAVSP